MSFIQDDSSASVADGNSLAFTSSIGGGGRLLTAHITINSTTITVAGITDTLGNTWFRAKQFIGTAFVVEIWVAWSPSGGANTLTFDWSGAILNQVTMAEFDSFPDGVFVDQSNGANYNATTGVNCNGSITTTQAVGVGLTVARNTTAFTISVIGDSFVALTYQSRTFCHYKIFSTTETVEADITFAALEQGSGCIANVYNPAAAVDLPYQPWMHRGPILAQ